MDGHSRVNFGEQSVARLWFSIEILPGFCELVVFHVYSFVTTVKNISLSLSPSWNHYFIWRRVYGDRIWCCARYEMF